MKALSLWHSYGFVILVSLLCGILTPPIFTRFDLQMPLFRMHSDFKRYSSRRIIQEVSNNEKKKENKNKNTISQYVPCNQEHLSQFLHADPVKGIHILCFDNSNAAANSADGNVQIYFQSHELNGKTISTRNASDSTTTSTTTNTFSWRDFIHQTVVAQHLHIAPPTSTNTQPWAIYTITGGRIVGELDYHPNNNFDDDDDASNSDDTNPWESLKQHGMVLLFEGGSFLWPGVRIGFKRQIQVDTGYNSYSHDVSSRQTLEMETLSLHPLVLSVQNFISMDECDHIQKLAMPHMQYSQVTLMDKDVGRPASDFRTSQSTFLPAKKDVIMNALQVRTASLTKVPINHQEDTQVLRYEKGERYTAHLDWFDPQLYRNDPSTLELIQHGKRNRLVTVFWYLSHVPQGGETSFPRYNNGPPPRDFVSNVWCDNHGASLKVKPEKGKVILFYSLLADGSGDVLSLHGACPVEEGVKWAANKWVWNAPMGFVS